MNKIAVNTYAKMEKMLDNHPEDLVNHPNHYGGENNPYEAIKIIEAHDLNFHLGNAIKYILRSGKKCNASCSQDLQKAVWYLERHLDNLIKEQHANTNSN